MQSWPYPAILRDVRIDGEQQTSIFCHHTKPYEGTNHGTTHSHSCCLSDRASRVYLKGRPGPGRCFFFLSYWLSLGSLTFSFSLHSVALPTLKDAHLHQSIPRPRGQAKRLRIIEAATTARACPSSALSSRSWRINGCKPKALRRNRLVDKLKPRHPT
jgi:hypothetical protein